MTKVLCMMSGGVDSNVAAHLLKQQGYDVVGVTLSLWWQDGDNTCCGVAANCRALSVCEKLGIEHFALNKRSDFMKYVVDPYVDAHRNGLTPSPCINCNTHVKIGGMIKYADFLGCDYIATGHYVKKVGNGLFVAKDNAKDQTYMLARVSIDSIGRFIFPLGDLLKDEIRNIADENGIISPKDSQDLCFVQSEDRSEFLAERGIQFVPGDFVDEAGKILGSHTGLCNYTVGQRRGLPNNSEKLFVLRVNKEKNQIVLGSGNSLFNSECVVRDFNWLHRPSNNTANIKVRYKAEAVSGKFYIEGDFVRFVFDQPQRAVTPGQAAVLYDEDRLVGGGWII